MSTIVKPDRPGTVIRFIGERIPSLQPSFSEVVAVPLVHDWGPIGVPTLVTSLLDFDDKFGNGDTAGRRAVIQTLTGQGAPFAPGAGGVLVYRMAAAAAAKATKTVQNTTPVNALTVTAKHKGTRGNDLSFVIEDDVSVSGNDLFRLLYKGAEQEKYSYVQTDIASLVAQITARSQWIDAASLITGVALTATVGTALLGGNSGLTLTSAEWVGALNALEFGNFELLAPYDLTDTGITATLVAWLAAQEAANRPVMAVIGGLAGETITTAVARSAAAASDHVVNLGVGTYHDEVLNLDFSTAQLAPRIAGILAARGESRSLTFAKIAGLTSLGNGPAGGDFATAIANGVTVLSQATSPDASLKIEKGVTTWTSAAVASKPKEIFSDARLVRVMDIFIRGMKQWGDDIAIGDLPVNDDSRALVRGEAKRRTDDLEARGLINPGTAFVDVPVLTDPTMLDAIVFDFGWQFARTLNYLFGNGRIR